jgi:predicted RNA binding protein with dsRBD fold (UPF0201 family)
VVLLEVSVEVDPEEDPEEVIAAGSVEVEAAAVGCLEEAELVVVVEAAAAVASLEEGVDCLSHSN